MDLSDPAGVELLKPLFPVLDRCWLIPVHVTLGISDVDKGYRNMALSYRGSERQPPNTLQMALRFSAAMEVRQKSSERSKNWATEERLRAVVEEFHSTPGLAFKHHIDEDRFRGMLSLITGTCHEARQIVSQHLDHFKNGISRLSAWSNSRQAAGFWALHRSWTPAHSRRPCK